MKAILVLLVLAAGAFGFWIWNTRATMVMVDASPPTEFPTDGFSHASFEELLGEYVVDGRVHYSAWHADPQSRAKLDSYLAAIAAYSPDSHPQRFPHKNDALAYWMYAYNAFVIKAILDRWPLDSVTDVKAPVEVVRGLGFFYTLKFVAGGERYTLYRLEHDKVIKPSSDPRVHFVLNCGSGGCPIVRPKLPTGAALEPYLQQATLDFVSDPANVSIDHDNSTIALSTIFKWYEDDFVAAVRARGLPSERGALAYVMMVAPGELRTQLEAAADYKVTFPDYDWSVNSHE